MADRLRREYRFTTLPEHLVRDKAITHRAVRLWCILDRYAGADGEAFPLRATLADDLSCSVATVDRALAELVKHGWLTKERRGEGDSNIYTLLIAKAPKAPRGRKAQVSPAPVVMGEDTPVLMGEDTLSSSVTTPVLMGEAHKEESPKEASTKETTRPDADAPDPTKTPADLNEGREDVERLCAHLSQRLTEREVRHTVGKTWRDEARRMLDLDRRTEEQVHNMIEWTHRSPFWRANIHSMPTLREKYDQMREQALRDTAARPIENRHIPTDPDARAKYAAAWGD